MPVRGPLARVLLWSGVLGAGALGVVGGLSLRGPGLVAVGLAATLAACTAAGIARGVRPARPPVDDRGRRPGRGLDGGRAARPLRHRGAGRWRGRRPRRSVPRWPHGWSGPRCGPRSGRAGRTAGGRRSATGTGAGRRAPAAGANGAARAMPGRAGLLPPVWTLTTPALGQEWLASTVALAGRLDAGGPAVARQPAGRRRSTSSSAGTRTASRGGWPSGPAGTATRPTTCAAARSTTARRDTDAA